MSPEYEANSGKVYFVQKGGRDGLVKIGFTTQRIDARIVGLRSEIKRSGAEVEPMVAILCVPGDMAAERQLHIRFGALRRFGEWFLPGPELLSFIEAARVDPGVVVAPLPPDVDLHVVSRRNQWNENRRAMERAKATLGPAGVAAAGAMQRWMGWMSAPGGVHGDCPADRVMIALGVALETEGYVKAGKATRAGRRLLDLARAAGLR